MFRLLAAVLLLIALGLLVIAHNWLLALCAYLVGGFLVRSHYANLPVYHRPLNYGIATSLCWPLWILQAIREDHARRTASDRFQLCSTDSSHLLTAIKSGTRHWKTFANCGEALLIAKRYAAIENTPCLVSDHAIYVVSYDERIARTWVVHPDGHITDLYPITWIKTIGKFIALWLFGWFPTAWLFYIFGEPASLEEARELDVPRNVIDVIMRRLTYPIGHCQACGYNLTGITIGPCPECGTDVRASRAGVVRSGRLQGFERSAKISFVAFIIFSIVLSITTIVMYQARVRRASVPPAAPTAVTTP